MFADMEKYLVSSTYIDWDDPNIVELAEQLSADTASEGETIKNCYEWVRDIVKHSVDYRLNPVTCKASDVLLHGTGYCYAKSHLLAALLRANAIPAGLCYQRLSIDGNGAPFSLHGLNAVFLNKVGWYRLDARGNKEGVDAQFTPPKEQLAFQIRLEQEADLPEILAEPLDIVSKTLERYKTWVDVYNNLPDTGNILKKNSTNNSTDSYLSKMVL